MWNFSRKKKASAVDESASSAETMKAHINSPKFLTVMGKSHADGLHVSEDNTQTLKGLSMAVALQGGPTAKATPSNVHVAAVVQKDVSNTTIENQKSAQNSNMATSRTNLLPSPFDSVYAVGLDSISVNPKKKISHSSFAVAYQQAPRSDAGRVAFRSTANDGPPTPWDQPRQLEFPRASATKNQPPPFRKLPLPSGKQQWDQTSNSVCRQKISEMPQPPKRFVPSLDSDGSNLSYGLLLSGREGAVIVRPGYQQPLCTHVALRNPPASAGIQVVPQTAAVPLAQFPQFTFRSQTLLQPRSKIQLAPASVVTPQPVAQGSLRAGSQKVSEIQCGPMTAQPTSASQVKENANYFFPVRSRSVTVDTAARRGSKLNRAEKLDFSIKTDQNRITQHSKELASGELLESVFRVPQSQPLKYMQSVQKARPSMQQLSYPSPDFESKAAKQNPRASDSSGEDEVSSSSHATANLQLLSDNYVAANNQNQLIQKHQHWKSQADLLTEKRAVHGPLTRVLYSADDGHCDKANLLAEVSADQTSSCSDLKDTMSMKDTKDARTLEGVNYEQLFSTGPEGSPHTRVFQIHPKWATQGFQRHVSTDMTPNVELARQIKEADRTVEDSKLFESFRSNKVDVSSNKVSKISDSVELRKRDSYTNPHRTEGPSDSVTIENVQHLITNEASSINENFFLKEQPTLRARPVPLHLAKQITQSQNFILSQGRCSDFGLKDASFHCEDCSLVAVPQMTRKSQMSAAPKCTVQRSASLVIPIQSKVKRENGNTQKKIVDTANPEISLFFTHPLIPYNSVHTFGDESEGEKGSMLSDGVTLTSSKPSYAQRPHMCASNYHAPCFIAERASVNSTVTGGRTCVQGQEKFNLLRGQGLSSLIDDQSDSCEYVVSPTPPLPPTIQPTRQAIVLPPPEYQRRLARSVTSVREAAAAAAAVVVGNSAATSLPPRTAAKNDKLYCISPVKALGHLHQNKLPAQRQLHQNYASKAVGGKILDLRQPLLCSEGYGSYFPPFESGERPVAKKFASNLSKGRRSVRKMTTDPKSQCSCRPDKKAPVEVPHSYYRRKSLKKKRSISQHHLLNESKTVREQEVSRNELNEIRLTSQPTIHEEINRLPERHFTETKTPSTMDSGAMSMKALHEVSTCALICGEKSESPSTCRNFQQMGGSGSIRQASLDTSDSFSLTSIKGNKKPETQTGLIELPNVQFNASSSEVGSMSPFERKPTAVSSCLPSTVPVSPLKPRASLTSTQFSALARTVTKYAGEKKSTCRTSRTNQVLCTTRTTEANVHRDLSLPADGHFSQTSLPDSPFLSNELKGSTSRRFADTAFDESNNVNRKGRRMRRLRSLQIRQDKALGSTSIIIGPNSAHKSTTKEKCDPENVTDSLEGDSKAKWWGQKQTGSKTGKEAEFSPCSKISDDDFQSPPPAKVEPASLSVWSPTKISRLKKPEKRKRSAVLQSSTFPPSDNDQASCLSVSDLKSEGQSRIPRMTSHSRSMTSNIASSPNVLFHSKPPRKCLESSLAVCVTEVESPDERLSYSKPLNGSNKAIIIRTQNNVESGFNLVVVEKERSEPTINNLHETSIQRGGDLSRNFLIESCQSLNNKDVSSYECTPKVLSRNIRLSQNHGRVDTSSASIILLSKSKEFDEFKDGIEAKQKEQIDLLCIGSKNDNEIKAVVLSDNDNISHGLQKTLAASIEVLSKHGMGYTLEQQDIIHGDKGVVAHSDDSAVVALPSGGAAAAVSPESESLLLSNKEECELLPVSTRTKPDFEKFQMMNQLVANLPAPSNDVGLANPTMQQPDEVKNERQQNYSTIDDAPYSKSRTCQKDGLSSSLNHQTTVSERSSLSVAAKNDAFKSTEVENRNHSLAQEEPIQPADPSIDNICNVASSKGHFIKDDVVPNKELDKGEDTTLKKNRRVTQNRLQTEFVCRRQNELSSEIMKKLKNEGGCQEGLFRNHYQDRNNLISYDNYIEILEKALDNIPSLFGRELISYPRKSFLIKRDKDLRKIKCFGWEYAPPDVQRILPTLSRYTVEHHSDTQQSRLTGLDGKSLIMCQSQLLAQITYGLQPRDVFGYYSRIGAPPNETINQRLSRYADKRRIQNVTRRFLENLLLNDDLLMSVACHQQQQQDLDSSKFIEEIKKIILLPESTPQRSFILFDMFLHFGNVWNQLNGNFISTNASPSLSLAELSIVLNELDLWPAETNLDDRNEICISLCSAHPDFLSLLQRFQGIPQTISSSVFVNSLLSLPYNLPDFPAPDSSAQHQNSNLHALKDEELILVALDICYVITNVKSSSSLTYQKEQILLSNASKLIDGQKNDIEKLCQVADRRLHLLSELGLDCLGYPPMFFNDQDLLCSRFISIEELQSILILTTTTSQVYKQKNMKYYTNISVITRCLHLIIGLIKECLSEDEWNWVIQPFQMDRQVPRMKTVIDQCCQLKKKLMIEVPKAVDVKVPGMSVKSRMILCTPIINDEMIVSANAASTATTAETDELSTCFDGEAEAAKSTSSQKLPLIRWTTFLDHRELQSITSQKNDFLHRTPPNSNPLLYQLSTFNGIKHLWDLMTRSDGDPALISGLAGDPSGLLPIDVTSLQVCCRLFEKLIFESHCFELILNSLCPANHPSFSNTCSSPYTTTNK